MVSKVNLMFTQVNCIQIISGTIAILYGIVVCYKGGDDMTLISLEKLYCGEGTSAKCGIMAEVMNGMKRAEDM